MADDEYSTRLARALKEHGQLHPQVLADHLGVSLQAVRKVLEGKSAAFNVFNHFEACRFLGVDAEWLATGDGQKAAAAGEQPDAGRITDALEVIAKALLKVDKDTREAVGHSLASMANAPKDVRNKSRPILRLLVTNIDSPPAADDGPRTTGKVGVLIGGSATRDLGDKDGRSDRNAGPRTAKK